MSEQNEYKVEKKKSKKGLFVFLAIIVVIVGFILGDKISDSIESKKAGEKLDIGVYYNTFDANEKLAEETYIGNRYTVTGTILEIDNFGANVEIHVSTSSGNKNTFIFIPYDENDVITLSKGQTVTATGTLISLPHIWGGRLDNAVFSVE